MSVLDPLSVFPLSFERIDSNSQHAVEVEKNENLPKALALPQPGLDVYIFFWPRKSSVGILESPNR
jgi:hypothetical protein